MKVKADDLEKTVSKVLAEYEDATLEVVEKAVNKTAKEAVERLKQSSPVRTGAYAKSWSSKKKKEKNKWAHGKVVFNKKYYRLTHLLEHGHAKVNGGFVAARPHIEKVERDAINNLVREIKEGV